MQIEVPDRLAAEIEAVLATGRYASAGELIEDLFDRMRGSIDALPSMREQIDLDQLKATQNAGRLNDFRVLAAGFWSSEEQDEFLHFLKASRADSTSESFDR